MSANNLVFVLGDQLSLNLSSLRRASRDRDQVLMVEVSEETTYVPHHKKKIAFVLSAMRHFAEELRRAGWQVSYVRLDDPDNTGSFTGELKRACAELRPRRIVVTEPGEWRVRAMMDGWAAALGRPVDILEDDRFVMRRQEFADWARDRKQLRMEYFYREVRKKTGLLMDGSEPAGGRWNFDADNRKPATGDLFMPRPRSHAPDAVTAGVLDLVSDRFAGHFGSLEPFGFAVTRADAQAAFDRFVEAALPSFGDYQDAMVRGEPFLYHSVVSAYLNVGLLDPISVCWKAEAAYRSGHAPLNAVEGFVRQIIGWREYVRGLYWYKMPDYVELNVLQADRSLPAFYWTGETDMRCMAEAIGQTKEEAYAHHIQRLMVTGNFALLAGIAPQHVHEWYLSVYVDAFEWVELPNTLGMSQFADGGILGSKPYAASGNYINKMSDYCSACAYDVKQKTGARACPFNALYWDFLDRNRSRLASNARLAQPYSTWKRMAPERKDAYLQSAAQFLERLRTGERV
ncbi:MAG: cryptochrome/photolyase family protein [Roseibium sp.]|nr:cryptochrome/photolyase family protein [Roseibium sp.]